MESQTQHSKGRDNSKNYEHRRSFEKIIIGKDW